MWEGKRARQREFRVRPAGVKGGGGGRGRSRDRGVWELGVLGSAGLCFRKIPVTHHTFQFPSSGLTDSVRLAERTTATRPLFITVKTS